MAKQTATNYGDQDTDIQQQEHGGNSDTLQSGG